MGNGNKQTAIKYLDPKKGDQVYGGLPARDLAYEEITNIPLAVYLTKAGRILNTVPAVYYDTAVAHADAAVTQQTNAKMFMKGLGDEDRVFNTGTAIPNKPKCLTNMVSDGEFEGGVTFIMEEISVELFIMSDKLTTFALGEVSDPTLTAEANFSSSAHYYAITRQMEIAFFRNEQEMITGRLHEFPSIFLASGAYGNDEGFTQNGVGIQGWNKLPRARVLETNDKFSFQLRYIGNAGFTPQVPFNVCVNIIGKSVKPLFQ